MDESIWHRVVFPIIGTNFNGVVSNALPVKGRTGSEDTGCLVQGEVLITVTSLKMIGQCCLCCCVCISGCHLKYACASCDVFVDTSVVICLCKPRIVVIDICEDDSEVA